MTFYEIFSDCNFKEEARTAIPEDWEFVCIESTDRYQVYMCKASNVKVFHSEGANYLIALDTGLMISWGISPPKQAEQQMRPSWYWAKRSLSIRGLL